VDSRGAGTSRPSSRFGSLAAVHVTRRASNIAILTRQNDDAMKLR
jgi:hypothetical protein